MTEIIPAYLLDDDETTEVQALIDEEARLDEYQLEANRWHIDGIKTAEWAMRHVRGATKQLAGIHEQAEAFRDELRTKLAMVDDWEANLSREPRRKIDFFGHHLEIYTAAIRRESEGKVKTLALPSGKVTTREASEPAIEIVEGVDAMRSLVAWVKANLPDGDAETVIKTTEKVLISELRRYLRITKASDEPDAPDVVLGPGDEPVPSVVIRYPEMTLKVIPN